MAEFANWNMAEYERIWESARDTLEEIAKTDVERSNKDLRAAQAARKQKQEDGYTYEMTRTDRPRVNIFPTTARAIAHDAVNHSIVKNLPMGTIPVPPANRSVPQELAERANEVKERKRVFMSHVRAFT